MQIFITFGVALLLLTQCHAIGQLSALEGDVIAECLESFGGLTQENAIRLQRFKDWSETYEEIPCFTKCYLNKLMNFYNESSGFNYELIKQQYGEPLFEACKHRLAHGENSCENAYSGLHCIVTLENDPFITIDSMKNLRTAARQSMKECLYKFDAFEWERLHDYAKFPVREPIPCYTKCFIDKLQLYNSKTRAWAVNQMQTLLGIPLEGADYSHCHGLRRRRNRNACAWMYQEFTCFVMAT